MSVKWNPNPPLRQLLIIFMLNTIIFDVCLEVRGFAPCWRPHCDFEMKNSNQSVVPLLGIYLYIWDFCVMKILHHIPPLFITCSIFKPINNYEPSVSDSFDLNITDIFNRKKGGYGVNIHDTKTSYVQVNTKQRNSA